MLGVVNAFKEANRLGDGLIGSGGCCSCDCSTSSCCPHTQSREEPGLCWGIENIPASKEEKAS